MSKETDIHKVVRQHLEMEQFFSGFSIRRPKASLAGDPRSSSEAHQARPFDKLRAGSEPDRRTSSSDHPVSSIQNRASSNEKASALEKIAGEVRQCRQCGLGSTRTNAVPGEGHADARIMFIGEAPGGDEDVQGRPFVGRAGQLLDKIINACGLKRTDVFIGNILKCRPPDNRDPRAEEIISCLPYLQKQIEIIEPEVIVALGAHAAKTLLDTTKSIGQLRGQFHEYYAGIGRPPIKLMATYHTAYLLRSYTPENRRRVWEDMKKVLAELDLPVPE
jgi:uracil-DNA glycosylase family 4